MQAGGMNQAAQWGRRTFRMVGVLAQGAEQRKERAPLEWEIANGHEACEKRASGIWSDHRCQDIVGNRIYER